MILLFILGCLLLIATFYLLINFVADMHNHKYTSTDVLSVMYMLAAILFIINALIVIYCYTEQIDILASINLMNPNWC